MSHYDVLGVPRSADAAAVRRAYLELARRHHPDRAGGDPDRMRAINEAWATLGDPTRRRRYDLTLDVLAPPPRPEPPWAPDTVGEDDEDDDDERPFGVAVPAAGWYALVPVGLFAASVLVGLVGLVMALPGVLGVAFLLFALSCLAFLAAPLLSLYASRRATDGGPARGHR